MPNCLEKKGWVGGSSQYLQPKSPSPEVWWDDLCVWQSWTGVFHLSRYHWCVSPWDFIKTVPKAAFLFLPKWSEFSETDVFSTPQPARGFSPSLLTSSWNFTCIQAWCHLVHVHRQRPQLCSSSPDGVWSNLGRLKATAGEEWHTFLVLLTAKCAQTLKTGRISLLPETLLCVCTVAYRRGKLEPACRHAWDGCCWDVAWGAANHYSSFLPLPLYVLDVFFYSHSFPPSVNTASPCEVALQSTGELCRERDRLRSRSDAQVI